MMYGENFGMCLRCIMKIFLKVYVWILGMVLKVYGENFPKGVWQILGMVLKVYDKNFLKVHGKFRYGAKGVWRKFS